MRTEQWRLCDTLHGMEQILHVLRFFLHFHHHQRLFVLHIGSSTTERVSLRLFGELHTKHT